jgi:predicted dehydrogenase
MIRWGLIGAGDIARKRVAAALRDGAGGELVAVSRARAELAAAFAQDFGARRWYAEWRELIADPEIDAVYVATPVDLHAAHTIAAAEAGKHVLCEKPLGLDVTECDAMIAACRANGVRLGVAYYRHFYPVIRRIRHLLGAGEIGEPVYAQMHAFERFDPPPDFPRAWLLVRERAGGGPMFDFGCHRLEVLLTCFGPVRTLSAVVANVVLHRDVEDTAAALLQFERGVCATLAVTHVAAESRDTFEIVGSRGSLRVGSLNKGDLTIVRETTPGTLASTVEHHPPAANLHQPLVEEFNAAMREGRDPAVPGEAGREVAALEDAIYAGWRAERPLDTVG